MGKRTDKSKLQEMSLKKVKLCEDDGNIEPVIKHSEPLQDLNNFCSSELCETSISNVGLFASKDKSQPEKKSKKRKKKANNPKSVGNGNELNLACLAYLKQWKNDKKSWKFEKIKQIRLTLNMFDKEKLPNKYFDIFLEYMEKASENMKKLLMTRASEVICNVEKWNELNDEKKLTSPKPKSYEGYERARDLLQRFE